MASSNGISIGKCKKCKDYRDELTYSKLMHFSLDSNFKKLIKKGSKGKQGNPVGQNNPVEADNPERIKPIEEFLQHVNAILNSDERRGNIIFHVEDQAYTDKFNQKVDDKLRAMIPDNSIFDSVYDAYYRDEKHFVFAICLKDIKVPYAVVDFKTTVSLNQGTANISYGQMESLVKHICNEAHTKRDRIYSDKVILVNGQKAKVKRTFNNEQYEIHLTENKCVQAKAITGEKLRQPRDSLIREFYKLSADYVTAFCKNEHGGSVYIGIGEGEPPKKSTESGAQGNTPHKMKQKGEPQENMENKTQEKAKTSKIGKKSDHKLLYVWGLPIEEHGDLHLKVKKAIIDNMTWIGNHTYHENQVSVDIHPVDCANINVIVIEIKVQYYHGLCFRGGGPLLYKASWATGDYDIKQLEAREWLDKYVPREILTVFQP